MDRGKILSLISDIMRQYEQILSYCLNNKINRTSKNLYFYFIYEVKSKIPPSLVVNFIRQILKEEIIKDKRAYQRFCRNVTIECQPGKFIKDIIPIVRFFSVHKFTDYIIKLINLNIFKDYEDLSNILDEIVIYLLPYVGNNIKYEEYSTIYTNYYINDDLLELSLQISKIFYLFELADNEQISSHFNRYLISEFMNKKWKEIKEKYI
jgi:hypothetical protein